MLCAFANNFPDFVADFLQRGLSLKRRFREETVTDILMSHLLVLGKPMIIVEFPNEPITGADMEWNFVNPFQPSFFRILLQAKQSYGNGKLWRRHSYRELFHKSGPGNKLQAETLCENARNSPATFPLYIFYHPAVTCNLARTSGANSLLGVNLSDGFAIERLAQRSGFRTGGNSLGTVYPHLFSFSDLLCPETIITVGPMARSGPMTFVVSNGQIGFAFPPSSGTVRSRVARIVDRTSKISALSIPSLDVVDTVPEVSSHVPEEVLEIIDRFREGRSDAGVSLNRWRVTFVSPRVTTRDAKINLE